MLILHIIVESYVVVVKFGVNISKICSPKYFFICTLICSVKFSKIFLSTSLILKALQFTVNSFLPLKSTKYFLNFSEFAFT